MKRLILASASPRRKMLLRQLGLDFDVISSNVEENIVSDCSPAQVVMRLAMDKAEDVYKRLNIPRVVIGADTVVVKDGHILGKPKDAREAFEMLKLIQGGYHHVFSGVAVLDSEEGLIMNDFDVTAVKVMPMDDERIRAYIATGEPMDKAGAYAVQGKGSIFIERIEGCYYNVVGLPIFKLFRLLEQCGITIL